MEFAACSYGDEERPIHAVSWRSPYPLPPPLASSPPLRIRHDQVNALYPVILKTLGLELRPSPTSAEINLDSYDKESAENWIVGTPYQWSNDNFTRSYATKTTKIRLCFVTVVSHTKRGVLTTTAVLAGR